MRKTNTNKIKCSKCNKKIDPLEVFPNTLCVDCYEKILDNDFKKTGILEKPDFIKCINKRFLK